jgi:hypothetical protein
MRVGSVTEEELPDPDGFSVVVQASIPTTSKHARRRKNASRKAFFMMAFSLVMIY